MADFLSFINKRILQGIVALIDSGDQIRLIIKSVVGDYEQLRCSNHVEMTFWHFCLILKLSVT